MIPIDFEDTNIVFEEIDINNSGTITLDELYYYIIDKFVGLP